MTRSAKMLMCKAIIYRANFDIIWCRVLKERETQIVKAAEMRVIRKIAGVRRIDHVRNNDIRH